MEIPESLKTIIENALKKGAAEQKKDIVQEAKEKKELYEEFIIEKIPKSYRQVRMEYYSFKPEAQISGYLRNLNVNTRRGLGVFLSGNPGTGKTCFAYALIKKYIWSYIHAKNPRDVCFTTFKQLQDSIINAVDKTQQLRFYYGRSLLVIDEFCVDGELSSSQKNNLLEILNKRISNPDDFYGKPTVFTSNQSLENIKTLAGPAIHDRIFGNCVIHEFTTKSRRTIKNRLILD